MAKIVTITNPLTGQPAQVDQLDHTAQQIDDGLNIARGVSNPNLLDNWYFGNPVDQRGGYVVKPGSYYWVDGSLAGTLDKYYPDGTKSEDVIHNSFAYAWLHHLHNNPHHPQYWYLRNDTDHDEDRMLDIPFNYIVEMLCDWGSFYYMDEEKKPGINPNSRARDWYNLHGEEFGFSDNTKNQIEKIFDKCLNL